jgi:hypothetical protein
MPRKKTLCFLVVLVIAAAALWFILAPPGADRTVPSLLGRPLRFDAPLIERSWKEIAAGEGLKKVFFREPLNRFFSQQALHCRVKFRGASQQALLAPAGGRIELTLNAGEGDRLSFTMFNAGAGRLTFRVKSGPRGREKLLFSGSPRGPLGGMETVLLSRAGRKTMRLLLETDGQGLGAWLNPCQLRAGRRPRTVLILMLDTLRADHVSTYGYKRPTTPVLDELAKGSLLFSRAFSTSSWTLPAHVSLFSGRDVLEHGVVAPESAIPADLTLLAETMQANGFVTLAQTGGGFVDDGYGFHRGFQSYASRADDIFQKETAGLLYASFAEDAAGFVDQDLFVFLHTYQMHAPYKAPDRYVRAFNPGLDVNLQGVGGDLRALASGGRPAPASAMAAERQKLVDLYDASILYSDQELLKPLLALLRGQNRYDDAMVVVLSDHGEEFFDHGGWEHGHTLYQELTRIPLVVKLPRQQRGEVRRGLTSICDVAGMIKAQYGFDADADPGDSPPAPAAQRVLELALPLSPFHDRGFGAASFVGIDNQYIHHLLPPAAAGAPAPQAPRDEWLVVAEAPGAADQAYAPAPALRALYQRLLAGFLTRLKALNKARGRIEPELLRRLKALGYLN